MQTFIGWVVFLFGAFEAGFSLATGAFPLALLGIGLMIYGYIKSHPKQPH